MFSFNLGLICSNWLYIKEILLLKYIFAADLVFLDIGVSFYKKYILLYLDQAFWM